MHARVARIPSVAITVDEALEHEFDALVQECTPLVFRVAFKPTATVLREQKTVTNTGEDTTLAARGRHDACVLPRAVPMVEAMVHLVLADHFLRQRAMRG